MNLSTDALARIRSSITQVGFAGVSNSIEDALLDSLRKEAAAQYRTARRAIDDGVVSYRSRVSSLGEEARAFLMSARVIGFLEAVFDQSFVLNLDSSCYTYFGAGDFLSAHRDGADECAVTVLVYVHASSPDPSNVHTGLSLQIYEDSVGKPTRVKHAIKTQGGLLVVGRGSEEWHGRPRLLEGERVSMVTACFTLVP